MRSLRSLRVLVLLAAAAAGPARAATFNCAGGDVTCLINSINTANGAGGSSVINLAAGTYNLTSVNNTIPGREGPNGLPWITSVITIQGAGVSSTIIQRAAGAPCFRIFDVLNVLILNSLTIQAGDACNQYDQGLIDWGGLGVLNWNTASLTNVAIRGMSNQYGGSGAGIRNRGSLGLTRTLVEGNQTSSGDGAGILNEGTMQINRSTIRNNHAVG